MKTILLLFCSLLLFSCSDDKSTSSSNTDNTKDKYCADINNMPNGAENTYVRIVAVLPNPTGNDDYNERFRVQNFIKSLQIDLDTYKIRDDEGTIWKLSELPKTTSGGSSVDGCQYVEYKSDKVAQLLNSGDTIFLYDSDENLIQTFSFGASSDGEWVFP